jgi:HEAT repeat protein/MFS family permease
VSSELTTAEKLRRLPWAIVSDSSNAIFVYLTFFGSVFVLYLGELGLSKTEIGSLLSLLPFAGLIALFIAPAVARFGYKRTYLIFFGGRKAAAALLLLTPWVLATFGSQAVTRFIIVIVAVFAIVRAVAITAQYPWIQEYVPSSVRGKYSAVDLMFWSLASFLAVTWGGFVLGSAPELSDFSILFAVGLLFGLISLGVATLIPGGAPVRAGPGQVEQSAHRGLFAPARDHNFRRYILGVGCTLLATGPLASFLPLFLQEEVGLNSGYVVWLQAGTLLGGLAFSFVWGWAADRYGAKPVMSSGAYLLAALPLLWWLMPRGAAPGAGEGSELILYIALIIAVFQGVANLGWQIGSGRMLFVGVVPPDKKVSYMALYYAWIGIIGGLGQLFGGRLLDEFAWVSGQFLVFPLDAYAVLFLIAAILPLLNVLLLRGVRTEDTVGVARFAGFFLRGNLLRATESLIQYHWARDERATVSVTERLGQARSPLTADELLEALEDPRFYVRFEAIVSIARGGADPRLTEALVEVLSSKEPALSVIAAWALGRMGDERALPALREGLGAPYRSVQAHCARSLGSLGDAEAAPLLVARLEMEPDEDLRLAFASALGALNAEEAVRPLLELLYERQDDDGRLELALALGRMVGGEAHFIQLWRGMRGDAGTVASQTVTAVRRRLGRSAADEPLLAALDECAEVLGRGDLEQGASSLAALIPRLPVRSLGAPAQSILGESSARLREFGTARREYLLLALHAMQEGW